MHVKEELQALVLVVVLSEGPDCEYFGAVFFDGYYSAGVAML